LNVVRSNVEAAGFSGRARIVPSRAESFLKKPSGPYDIVFLDPPYAMDLGPLLDLIARSGTVKPGGDVIAEHFKKQPSPPAAGTLSLYREARYGDTILAFYR
jgi:16S rRNA (guanine966-N2)-methyltransferase